jgi:hypothetical protein
LDAGEFIGNSLLRVDEASIGHVAGVVAVVVIRDFVGIVCEREEQAIAAARDLKVEWRVPPELADLNRPEGAIRAQASQPRVLLDRGDVKAATENAAKALHRTYLWPFQMHASIGPSCSVADWRADGLTLWSGTQNPLMLRGDLARLLGMPETHIEIIRHEAAGCYGRNCADDVGADAALLSRAVGRPVRVQLSREQEHAWEPKGAGQVMDVKGGLDAEGGVAAYDFETRYPSNVSPTLALLLTGVVAPVPVRDPDGRPHRHPALRLRQRARHGARHGADRAGLMVSRRLGAPEQFRARILDRRVRDGGGRGPDRVSLALSPGRARGRPDAGGRGTRGVGAAYGPGQPGRRGRCSQRAWLRPGAVQPRHLPGHARRVVRLGDGCRGEPSDRRGRGHPRRGRPG